MREHPASRRRRVISVMPPRQLLQTVSNSSAQPTRGSANAWRQDVEGGPSRCPTLVDGRRSRFVRSFTRSAPQTPHAPPPRLPPLPPTTSTPHPSVIVAHDALSLQAPANREPAPTAAPRGRRQPEHVRLSVVQRPPRLARSGHADGAQHPALWHSAHVLAHAGHVARRRLAYRQLSFAAAHGHPWVPAFVRSRWTFFLSPGAAECGGRGRDG